MRKSPRSRVLPVKHLFSLGVAIASLAALPSAQALTVSNWNAPGTSGTWSDVANWDNGVPNSSDFVANIAAGSSTNTIVKIDASSWALSGITGTSTNSYSAQITGSNTVLDLGSGGLTLSSTTGQLVMGGIWWQTQWNNLTINAVADQTWRTANANGGGGGLVINAALTGTSVITLAAVNPDWQAGMISFEGGSSAGFTGSFVIDSGDIRLKNNGSFAGGSQLSRLGTNTTVWKNTNTFIDSYGTITKNALRLYLSGSSNTAETFATPIAFQQSGGASRYFTVWSQNAVTGSSLEVTGQWSGDLSNVGTYLYSGTKTATINSALVFQNQKNDSSDGNTEKQLLVRLTADNSGLTATGKTGGSGSTSAILFEEGAFSVENANTLGAGNTLSVALGAANSTLGYTALLAKGGIDIGGKIFIQGGGNGRVNTSKLGVLGTGTSHFTGDLVLGQGWSGNANTTGAGVRLSAGSGATAVFSGNISNGNSWDDVYATLTAEGGGKIVLAGNNNSSNFQSAISVIGNTTLQVDGKTTGVSAAGKGSLAIGAAAATLNNAVITSNGWKITGLASTAGLVIGQRITGTGIPDDSTITRIGADYIEISNRATATGIVSLSALAETGILSGTGRIAPGTVTTNSVTYQQAITLAAGSTIAPGDNGVGVLTLDGSATSATLLTAAEGSDFTFSLGLGGSSSQIAFWNYSAGDFALSGTGATLNFTGTLAEGTYTLFSFYSNGGTIASTEGITGGLNLGTGLDGYNGVLGYNGSTVTLTLTQAVPEPVTWVLLTSGLGVLVLGQRLRRRS